MHDMPETSFAENLTINTRISANITVGVVGCVVLD
jgi:hypothetical protein